jgi:hypothetical protein
MSHDLGWQFLCGGIKVAVFLIGILPRPRDCRVAKGDPTAKAPQNILYAL